MMLRVARRAMATRFECALEGSDAPRLQAAGEQMLDEIERWERLLSYYNPASELSRVNREAAGGPVRVSVDVFRVLQACDEVFRASNGAFDPTLAPVLKKWGLGGIPESPAGAPVGWSGVALDASRRTVFFAHAGLSIDLGGIGKGAALEAVREMVSDEQWMCDSVNASGVKSMNSLLDQALIHGGTSSAVALAGPFRIGIEDPHEEGALLDTVELTNEALSVSAVMGKAVDDQTQSGLRRGHVVDPRTGAPLTVDRVAAVVCPDAALADAWATALVVQPDLPSPTNGDAGGSIRQWMVFEANPDGAWDRIAGGQADPRPGDGSASA